MKLIRLCFLSLFMVLVFCGSYHVSHGQSCIYGGGPIYQHRDYAIDELRASGFTTVVVWTIHINASGDFNFNAEFPLCQGGSYVGASSYPNFASDMTTLKTAPTSVTRIDFCLSAWGSSTFANVKALIEAEGTGPGTTLYENFAALKAAIPAVDGIGFDDESTYDATTATALAVMLGNLGFKVSLVPYTAQSFWTTVAANTNAAVPGTVDRIDLQCYAGGSGNTPCSWDFGSIPVYPGLWDTYDTPAEVQTQMTTWKNSCGASGGFIWLYDDIDNSSATAAYAAAVNAAFSGEVEEGVVTVYEDCNYGGYAISLPEGSYTLSDLTALGMVNDDVSSFTVSDGYEIQIYWDDNFLGETLTFTADNACLVDEAWNDELSSIVVRAVSETTEAEASTTSAALIVASPNPTTRTLTLRNAASLSGSAYTILDKQGTVVSAGTLEDHTIDVSSLSPGIYLLEVSRSSALLIRRFIKR